MLQRPRRSRCPVSGATLALGTLLALALPRRATGQADSALETGLFRLHKLQQAIGEERYRIARDSTTLRLTTAFEFTDRGRKVALTAALHVTGDGSPIHFEIKGATSRFSTIDETVDIAGHSARVRVDSTTSDVAVPEPAFAIGGYAPIALQQALLRYWQTRGRPDTLPLLPSGRVVVAVRGVDTVTVGGASRSLRRLGIRGLIWGVETAWLDDSLRLVAVVTTDAEFDHFEAVREGYEDQLATFVSRAARDGAAALAQLAGANAADTGAFALTGGTLIDGTGAAPVHDGVIVVRRGRIAAVGPRARVRVPPGTPTVDVSGKYVLPGLWDMHAHYEQVEWGPIYLAAGVTTARDVGNDLDFITSVRRVINSGQGIGPTLLLAGIIDGKSPMAIGLQQAGTPAEGVALVERYHDAGFEQIKIYSSVSLPVLAAITRAAHRLGMTVTGHVPEGISTYQAIDSGMDQVNHVQYIRRMMQPPPLADGTQPPFDIHAPAVQRAIAFLKAHHTVLDPTLASGEWIFHPAREPVSAFEPGVLKVAPELAGPLTHAGMPPDREAFGRERIEQSAEIVAELHRAGVPIVAGTDQTVPGHSLHREIELYVKAGFTPLQAIQAATLVPARVMHLDTEVGTVTAGKRADLIVVDADPLQDVANLRKIWLVVARGRRFRPAPLWRSVGFEP